MFASRLMLRAIGGVSYLIYGLAHMIAPCFASHLVPWTQLPILAGEGSLCVWLLIRGVDSERWAGRGDELKRPTSESGIGAL